MSFNFHQVKTHEQSELFRLRARIILDIETFMSDEERADVELFPTFFQILQRKMRKAAEGERPLNSVVVVLWLPVLFLLLCNEGQDLHARLDAHKAAVDELCARTTAALAARDATISEMSRTLQLLLERSANANR